MALIGHRVGICFDLLLLLRSLIAQYLPAPPAWPGQERTDVFLFPEPPVRRTANHAERLKVISIRPCWPNSNRQGRHPGCRS